VFTIECIFEKAHDIQEQEGLQQQHFQTVLRAARQTETAQENIQDLLQLDKKYLTLQLLKEK
jgi:hypothetical protein